MTPEVSQHVDTVCIVWRRLPGILQVVKTYTDASWELMGRHWPPHCIPSFIIWLSITSYYLKFFLKIYLFYICEYISCMYIYTPHVCSVLRGQSTCWSPWSWDYVGFELPCGCWELIWVLCKNNTCSHHRVTPPHHFKKHLPLLLLLIFPISTFISSLLDRVLSQLVLNSLCSQRMALNFGSFCLHLLSAEIMGIYHHTSI